MSAIDSGNDGSGQSPVDRDWSGAGAPAEPITGDGGTIEPGGQAGLSVSPADARAAADRAIREVQVGLPAEEAVLVVAVLANRAAAELHRLAKAQATATRGTPEWGAWASLQNAARKLVLDATSARDGATKLAQQRP